MERCDDGELTLCSTGGCTEATGTCSSFYREPHLNLQDRGSRTVTRSGLQEIRLHSTSTQNKIHLDWCVWSSASALIRDAHPAHWLVSVSVYRLWTLTATTWKCVLQTCVLAEYLPSLFVVVVVDNLCAMLSGDVKNVEWTSEDAALARTTDRLMSSPALTKHSTRQNEKTTGASELKRSAERKTQPHLQEYTTRKYLAVWHTKQSVVFTVDRRWWMMSSGSFRSTKYTWPVCGSTGLAARTALLSSQTATKLCFHSVTDLKESNVRFGLTHSAHMWSWKDSTVLCSNSHPVYWFWLFSQMQPSYKDKQAPIYVLSLSIRLLSLLLMLSLF